jgi:chromosome partitioning protein
MPIVAVLNEKGGSGKTTTSTHLARGLQKEGYQVLLVDSDPQASARDWHAAAGEEADLPPVVGLDKPTLFKDLPRLSRGMGWVIIDGAPQLEDLSVAALKVADYVIIPVQPSPYDIWSTESLVELIKARQEITEGKPKAAFMISRQIVGTKLALEVREALLAYGLPILKSATCQRVIYPTSASSGSSVLDMEPEGPAAEEIGSLVEEVLTWR